MSSEFDIKDYARDQEIPKEELKASGYYLAFVNDLGASLGTDRWPKDLRLQVASYVRRPNEHMLLRLARHLADRAAQPSSKELEIIKNSASTIADRIHPSVTLALIYGRALDAVKVNTIGSNTPTTSVNSLMGVFFGETMWRAEGMEEADVEDTRRLAAAAARLEDPHYHWYVPKLLHIVQGAESRKDVQEFLPTVKSQEGQVSVEELAIASDELNDSLSRLQRYGLKPCVAPALPQSKTKEWLVLNFKDDNAPNYIAPYHPASRMVAQFYGSSKSIQSTEIEYVGYRSAFEDGSTIKLDAKVHPGLKREFRICDIALGSDGQLYYSSGQRWLDYLDPSLRMQYEQLRSEILSIYFDAVVPVYITEQVNQEASITPKRGLGKIAIGLKKSPDLRRLVLARNRILNENIEEVEEELKHPDTDLVNVEKRTLAKHEVVWHIRRLPNNFKASPEARVLCLKETGIELAEYGETYVKEHTRGSIDRKTKGHKVTFAAGKIASIMGRGSK